MVVIANALGQVCFGDEARFPLAETIDRYFVPGYRQCTNGEEPDRAAFVEHMQTLRRQVASGRVAVIEVIRGKATSRIGTASRSPSRMQPPPRCRPASPATSMTRAAWRPSLGSQLCRSTPESRVGLPLLTAASIR
jgi:hypothetical protein